MVDDYTGWAPPVISWFINHEIIPMNTIVISTITIVKPGTGADSGPGVFYDFDFNHSSLICLKLWRRDDFVVLLQLEMVFSSHITLGIYSLIIEFYWAK